MWAARVVVWGFDLGVDAGLRVLLDHYNPRCEPPWSEAELLHKCRDADKPGYKHPRGWLRDQEPERQARSPRSAPPPASTPPAGQGAKPAVSVGVEEDDPHRLARLYLAQHQHPEGSTLRFWSEEFVCWRDGAYDRVPIAELRADLTQFLEAEFVRLHAPRVKAYEAAREKGSDQKPPVKRRVTRALVGDVLQALQGACVLRSPLNPPAWIGDGPPVSEMIAARNGLLHLPSFVDGIDGSFTPCTPRYFTFNRVGFDFDPAAPEPVEWLQFLANLWPDDPDSIACLQEWFGYLLTLDTSMQKMLMLIGPPRSGKGTIARVLKALIGPENVAAPTLGALDDQFGLQGLVGKSLALIADARLSGRADAVAVTEQLLSISGEDPRMIDRKHREPVTMRLTTRFVFCSNELPRFGDASGAIVERLVLLRLTQSFLGREDLALIDRILPELPGIFLWAVRGWARLRKARRFTSPASAAELFEDAEALASPIRVFLRERCELGGSHVTPTQELYRAWREWCERQGRDRPGTVEMFVRDLRAAVPTLETTRPRDGSRRVPSYAGIRVLTAFEAGDIEL